MYNHLKLWIKIDRQFFNACVPKCTLGKPVLLIRMTNENSWIFVTKFSNWIKQKLIMYWFDYLSRTCLLIKMYCHDQTKYRVVCPGLTKIKISTGSPNILGGIWLMYWPDLQPDPTFSQQAVLGWDRFGLSPPYWIFNERVQFLRIRRLFIVFIKRPSHQQLK